ncbi:hypothetical protein MVEN_01206100 [Mycena venus]|uniref:RRM domain-containing protein n=1 Tax=Mycena venus TaxID=2733690 RepID=A0A8H6Y5Q3_9AGAR|nr:hypothetical protein MVEN_01206100 [Mycena venus]
MSRTLPLERRVSVGRSDAPLPKMSSSSSSSSSSSAHSTPEPNPKRKRDVEDSDSDSNSSDDSDVEEVPEVPVLSHAEQRRQKRREKQEKLGQPVKKRKLPDGSAATTGAPAKRQNSVWVGNLTFKTTPENLTEFFKEVGEITRINMPTKAPNAPGAKAENRGYAYVDFTTPEAQKAAIAMSEQNLFGRKLLIKDGTDFTGRPAVPGVDGAAAASGAPVPKTLSKTSQKILGSQKQPPAPTLFLGNLPFETTEQTILGLFEAHRVKKKAKTEDEEKPEGDDKWIRKVRMGTFEDSGKCKGFAFVDFTSIEHATSVLVNPKNHLLDGRKLVVEYASADAVRRGAPKGKREDGAAERMPQRRKEAKSRGPRAEKKLQREKDVPARKADSYAAPQDPDSGVAEPEQKRKGPKSRPKPGAALAQAKRESAAIVPSQGKKVVF